MPFDVRPALLDEVLTVPVADVTVEEVVVTVEVVDTDTLLLVFSVLTDTMEADSFLFSSRICSWCCKEKMTMMRFNMCCTGWVLWP